MVFGRTHALLAAASLLQLTSASAVNTPAGGEVTVTKTVTNTHTICPATTKPPVCKTTNGVTGPGNGGNGGNGGYNGGNNGGNGGYGPGSGNNPKDDADLWQSWLDKLSHDAQEAQKTTKAPHAPWHDWKPTGTGTGGPGPTDLPPFDGECTKPGDGLPENKCNAPGSRSKWCDGKSIDTDYYKEYKSGKTCKYTLEITNTTLSYDAGPLISFAINGQSPGPVIECNWGDWVEIDVINKLTTNATTIHWHGIHQKETNDQDGVPGVSECAVAPGQSRKYSWLASSYGTAWYHSHLLSQYGDGIRGPIIIHGPTTADYDIDMGHVMITDTFPAGTAAAQADRIAHFGQGAVVTSNYLLNGNNKAVDLSTGKHALWRVQPGKKHLFRIINGAAQEAYSVHLDGHDFEVISADFVPIKPYKQTWLNIAPGQRYDIIITANQKAGSYFLRAVTQTACPSTPLNNGLNLANGIVQYAGSQLTLPQNNFGNVTNATFATCADEKLANLVPHLKKSAGSSGLFTAGQKDLPAGRVAQPSANSSVVQWFINNNAMNISYTEPTLQSLATNPNLLNGVSATNGTALIRNSIVLGQSNQWVYFIVRNEFFAAHPMHLHGHDMSILGQGNGVPDVSTLNFENPARRDTVMLNGARGPNAPGGPGPLGYTVIGFETDNPGAWLMHCHIVWHVEGGMALQFVERPQDINAGKYANKPEFKEECKAMAKYEENPANRKHAGQSGLRIREMFGGDVVRRDINRHSHRHL